MESDAPTIWLRKPEFFVRDALANGYSKFVFDRALVTKMKLDVVSFMREMCIGVNPGVEYLLIGNQGAAHYTPLSVHKQPIAVYPVWRADTQSLLELEDLMASPVSEMDPATFEHLPPGLRPVPGQQHRVIVANLPSMALGITAKLMQGIHIASQIFPDCQLHLHGADTFGKMFQYPFAHVDFAPSAGMPSFVGIYLPNGIRLQLDSKLEWPAYEHWMNMLGYQFRQVVSNQRIRVMFNISSIHWAARYYNEDLRIKMRYRPTVGETIVPRSEYVPATDKLVIPARVLTRAQRFAKLRDKETNTDFVLCNGCAFRVTCKFVREGSVCIYKGAETVALADAFGSRNADRIIDGLGELLKIQTYRAERSIERETDKDEIDPDVTRQINALFKNGVLLAKLIDPKLNGKGTVVNVGVAVNGNAAQVAASDPRQLVANAVRALESQGIPRKEITPDMIKLLLQNPGQSVAESKPKPAIEGVVTAEDEDVSN